MLAITGEELADWVEETSRNWKRFLTAHPEVLALPCDIRETSSFAQLLQHIVAVELRYAERLNDFEQSAYDQIPYNTVEAIYATHDRALALLRQLMTRDADWWDTVVEVKTRSAGMLRATRRTILVHALTHSIRHYGQLATLARTNGFPPDWGMDYVLMPSKMTPA